MDSNQNETRGRIQDRRELVVIVVIGAFLVLIMFPPDLGLTRVPAEQFMQICPVLSKA